MRDFNRDLEKNMQDPEFAAYFAEAQIESNKELLACGVIKVLTLASQSSKTKRTSWRIK